LRGATKSVSIYSAAQKNAYGWSMTGTLDEDRDRSYVIKNKSFNGNSCVFGILTESSDGVSFCDSASWVSGHNIISVVFAQRSNFRSLSNNTSNGAASSITGMAGTSVAAVKRSTLCKLMGNALTSRTFATTEYRSIVAEKSEAVRMEADDSSSACNHFF